MNSAFCFLFTGKIAQKIGYDTSLSLCFMFFAVRLIALSFIPTPWWALPIEAVLHGFTYALSYATIVGYVNRISTPKIQGTMQGIVSGVYDGIGESTFDLPFTTMLIEDSNLLFLLFRVCIRWFLWWNSQLNVFVT